MARKKKVKRKSSRRKSPVSRAGSLQTRFNVARRSFFLFVVLSIFSYILYNFSTTELFLTFFGILSIVLAFVALAFLISLAVIFISKKKN